MFGEFNFVMGGSHFVMLHHLALSPLPRVDGKFPSENCLAPKLIAFGGVWAKEILVVPGNRPKQVQNGSDSAKYSRANNDSIT